MDNMNNDYVQSFQMQYISVGSFDTDAQLGNWNQFMVGTQFFSLWAHLHYYRANIYKH